MDRFQKILEKIKNKNDIYVFDNAIQLKLTVFTHKRKKVIEIVSDICFVQIKHIKLYDYCNNIICV